MSPAEIIAAKHRASKAAARFSDLSASADSRKREEEEERGELFEKLNAAIEGKSTPGEIAGLEIDYVFASEKTQIATEAADIARSAYNAAQRRAYEARRAFDRIKYGMPDEDV